MATIRKTITLTQQQDEWIKSKIVAGQFTNDSEYIRDLVRRDQERNNDIEAIRAALIEAESRETSHRTAEDIRQTVKERLKRDGQL
ncbi:type II toxin-antitoxin system ParD family antitoxin [Saccharospirillum salsuginis]|uniref:Antitoxin ParD n=1 Tax=Saccharospirillum salsuginis TaxID=418750 RepID=A0A918KQV6_9GAMM|nr:type II toxin-antitoxin system ParD family antitoxin [Saccharospirillum salsuginis]GGX72243.1 antitoxin protein parD-4 [Saccharospirillum salsuginis]